MSCPTCWLSYLTLVWLWCGRTIGRTVTWLPNFIGRVDYHILLPMVLRCARFARESSAIKTISNDFHKKIFGDFCRHIIKTWKAWANFFKFLSMCIHVICCNRRQETVSISKDCIKVQEKKRKVVGLCFRPRQNVKLGTFTLWSCNDG